MTINKEQKISNGMEAKVYNQQGQAVRNIKLPEQLFGRAMSPDLIYQIAVALRARGRRNTAQVKDRSQVRGGGRKPWRQKGTGQARHGSIRSPLWRGGGITHGPTTARNYTQKINKKMAAAAFVSALAEKQRDAEVLWLSELKLDAPKTAAAAAVIKNLSAIPGFGRLNFKRGRRAVIALPAVTAAVEKSFRNLPQVAVRPAGQLNLLDLLNYQYAVLAEPEQTLPILERKLAAKK